MLLIKILKKYCICCSGGTHRALFSNKLLADKMHWNLDISKLFH